MAFANLSFETADGSGVGCADGWTFASHAGARTWAPFHTTEAPWEDFEREWSTNQSYLFEFALLGITRADYQSNNPPKTFEDFEEYWTGNEAYVFGIAGTSAAYDTTPENFEDFEEDWVAGYLFAFVGVGSDLTAASYDVAIPEDFEDFEDDWVTGYLYALAGTTAAVYSDTNVFEKFDTADGWLVCNTV